MTGYEVANWILAKERLSPSIAATVRTIVMDTFSSDMEGMDRNRGTSAKQGASSQDAARAYHAAMDRTTEDEHIEGMPKPPAHDAGGDAFDFSYDGAGAISGARGVGYVFEIQRDTVGRMKRVIAKPQ